jgi:CBS domain-containing protein
MTSNPRTLDASETIRTAARVMRDEDIGAVIVTEGDRVRGIVTDRDIVVRAVAEGADAAKTTLGDIASSDIETVTPETSVEDAIEIMRMKAIRRLPVVDGDGRPVGIVSIGDLALERDRDSALADISAAPPNS